MQHSTKIQDPILLKVLAKYYERSEAGVKKYGKTLDRDDIDFIGWLNHLQEELMDATLYIERIRKDIAIEKTKSFSDGYREAMKNKTFKSE
jgi:hypothetical protein